MTPAGKTRLAAVSVPSLPHQPSIAPMYSQLAVQVMRVSVRRRRSALGPFMRLAAAVRTKIFEHLFESDKKVYKIRWRYARCTEKCSLMLILLILTVGSLFQVSVRTATVT